MAKKYNTDEYKQITTPANPTGGFNKIYFKADNKAYRLDSTGAETELWGSGGGGSPFATDIIVNSVKVGKWKNSLAANVVLWDYALDSTTTGNLNTAIGSSALNALTTGTKNVAVGNGALAVATTGSQNVAVWESANFLGNWSNNTAIWFESLKANQANGNTAVGSSALKANTTGNWNTAQWSYALYSNTIGYANTANWISALESNTIGTNNTAIWSNTLLLNTSGTNNTASWNDAMRSNTTGGYNTSNWNNSLRSNTTGNNNTASGDASLYSNTTGSANTSFGVSSLVSHTTGNFNTSIWHSSGSTLTTGSNNTFLGKSADTSLATVTNSTAIGNGAIVSADNQVVIGNASVTQTTLRGAVTGGSFNGVELTTGGGTTNFLRADGTYAAPAGTIPAIIDSSTATVTTTSTTASISGIDIISDGGYPVTEVGVVYYLSSEVQANRFKGISPSTTWTLADPYSVSLTGLTSNSSYLAKPYVITSQGTFYGSEVAVNTLFNFTGFRLGGAAFLTDTNLSVPLALTPKSAFPNIVSNYGAAFNENDGFIYSAPTANTNKYNATTGALVTTGNTNWTINDDTFMYKPTNTAYISRGSAGGIKKCVLSSFPTTSTVGSFSTWVYSSCIIVWGFIYAAANTSLIIRKINLTTELEVANVGVGTSAKILWADSTYIYVADNTNIKQIRMSDMVQTATVAFAGAFVISGLVYNGFLYTGESGLTTLRRYNTSTMTFSSALGTIPGASKIIENNGIIYTSDQNVPATLSSINPTSFTVISQQTFTTGGGAATYFLKV